MRDRTETIERLEQVIRVLENVKDAEFNLDCWRIDKSCGTTACAVGWAMCNPWFNARGLVPERGTTLDGVVATGAYQPTYQNLYRSDAVRAFFGLDRSEYRELFTSELKSHNECTRDGTIARIKRFCDVLRSTAVQSSSGNNTMEPQHLTIVDVIQANRKALEEGTLGALKRRTQGQYLYHDQCRCAIGTALSKEALSRTTELEKQTNEYLTVEQLAGYNIIQVSADEMSWMTELQIRHDRWACATGGIERECCRRDFVSWLAKGEEFSRQLAGRTTSV